MIINVIFGAIINVIITHDGFRFVVTLIVYLLTIKLRLCTLLYFLIILKKIKHIVFSKHRKYKQSKV